MGGAPVIIKLLEGTQGVGVILAESKGRDVRAFVVGDRVVAAMRRVATGTEFRSNVHRGGTTEAIELDERFSETAVRAAQIMGLRVAGVDMLEGAEGLQIMEVNLSPGLEGIEGCTGLDIAGAVIDYIAAQVDFPDVDIRQRQVRANARAPRPPPVLRQARRDAKPRATESP